MGPLASSCAGMEHGADPAAIRGGAAAARTGHQGEPTDGGPRAARAPAVRHHAGPAPGGEIALP